MTHNEHEFINLSRIQAHHITDCLQSLLEMKTVKQSTMLIASTIKENKINRKISIFSHLK